MSAPLKTDRSMVIRTIGLFLPSGQVTELRALEAITSSYRRPHIVSGYFDDATALADAVMTLGRAKGIYIVPNAVNPALLARSENRIRDVTDREPVTSDADITNRDWLMIDVDTVKPAGISSTDAEHDAALEHAGLICKRLGEIGFPEPIMADSGNGAHLLYRIDLPRDDGSLVKRALEGLDFRFSDDRLVIDRKVFNPARIWKFYGTLACKGDSTADRPHRVSAILSEPEMIEVVRPELLEIVASWLPAPPPAPERRSVPSTAGEFSLDVWVSGLHLDLIGPTPYDGGRKWVFRDCPWNPAEHRDRSAFLIQFASGAISAGCHHNGCTGKDWAALRDMLDPNWRRRTQDREAARAGPRTATPPKPSANGVHAEDSVADPNAPLAEIKRYTPTIISARELWLKEFPEPKWAVPGIIPDGVTIVAGKPKLGKSFLMFNAGCAIALGGKALGAIPVEWGEVLYLDVDSKSERRLKERLAVTLPNVEKPEHLHFATEWPRFGEDQGECHLEDWLVNHPACRMVVIDTLVKARRRTKTGLNPYEADTDAMDVIRTVSLAFGVSIVLVHHCVKAIPLDDPMDAIMGSMGITSASDCNLILQRSRGESDAVLHRSGRDLVDDESLAMDFDPSRGLWVVKGSAAEFAITKERKEILQVLIQQARPMTPTEMAETLGKKRQAVMNLFTRMMTDGLLQSLGGGRYLPMPKSEDPES